MCLRRVRLRRGRVRLRDRRVRVGGHEPLLFLLLSYVMPGALQRICVLRAVRGTPMKTNDWGTIETPRIWALASNAAGREPSMRHGEQCFERVDQVFDHYGLRNVAIEARLDPALPVPLGRGGRKGNHRDVARLGHCP